MSIGPTRIDGGLRRHAPAGRIGLKATVAKQIRRRCQADVIEPEGAGGSVVGVDHDGDHIGGRLIRGGYSDPVPTGANWQVDQGQDGSGAIMALEHPNPTRVARTAKGAETV